MELQELSSNWRKLQQTLKQDKAASSPDKPLKRKRVDVPSATKLTAKRTKLRPHSSSISKSQPMASVSSSSRKIPKQRSYSSPALARPEPLPAEDLSTSPTTTTSTPTETPRSSENEGVSPTNAAGKYIAIDCEMVGIGPTPSLDSQLARVSIVNYHGQQLYDSYVIPQLPITDYRTHVSGITPAKLRGARPFSAVQRDVARLLDGRILVGHGVKNDLEVLMLSHPRRDIRDTSRHPNFRRLSAGKTPSLKRLAKEILGIEIQVGQHSSVVDAQTSMELYRKEKEAFEAEHVKKWGKLPVIKRFGESQGASEKPKKSKGKTKKKKKKTKR